jgi:hypothetical protein
MACFRSLGGCSQSVEGQSCFDGTGYSHRNTIKTLIQELALLKEEFERPDLGNEPSESRIQ